MAAGVYKDVHDRDISRKSAPKSVSSRGYGNIILFPHQSLLMKKVRTGYGLLHKILLSRAIKVLLLLLCGKKIIFP